MRSVSSSMVSTHRLWWPAVFSWTVILAQSLFGLQSSESTSSTSASPPSIHETVPLWPDGLPAGSVQLDDATIKRLMAASDQEHIRYVDTASMTILPGDPLRAAGTAVIILPGGGYNVLAWPKEGLEVGRWLQSLGITAFVVQYRVPRRSPEEPHREPLQDAQRAIALVRHNAEQWNIKTDRVGVLGFSAGGHLTLMTAVSIDRSYPAVDAADSESLIPNFICPIYAAYLGDQYRDDVPELGSWLKVTETFPATFLAVTADDRLRGAQAALLAAKLIEQKVPVELHLWSKGGHGYGIRPGEKPVHSWPENLEAWLLTSGLIKPAE